MACRSRLFRIYWRLLGLYPGEFKDRFRQEMCDVLADRLRAERPSQRASVWLHAAAAVLMHAPHEHADLLLHDLRYAARALRRNRGFTAAAVAAIALAIGSATAVFSIVNAVLLRPLPYPDADRLVLARWDGPSGNQPDSRVSAADFLDFRRASAGAFEHLEAIGGAAQTIVIPSEAGVPIEVRGVGVSPDFLPMLGAKMALGRPFLPGDGAPPDADGSQPSAASQSSAPAPTIAILSHEYWQQRFRGDASILGRSFPQRGGGSLRIVGVLAPGFELLLPPALDMPRQPDVWFAYRLRYDNARRGAGTLRMIGKARSGLTLAQAQMQANAAARALSAPPAHLEPVRRYLASEVRPALLALMGAVIFLLLIACANVTNLLLVRTSLRERELAVRASLGGSLPRLMRSILAEAAWLAALGTGLGLVLAWAGIHELLTLAPNAPGLTRLPRLEAAGIDARVLGFAMLAGLLGIVLFGFIPAWRASRPDIVEALRFTGSAGSASAGPKRGLLRRGIVAVEIALCFVLLAGSGLMFRSFLALRRVDLGYDPRGLLTFLLNGDGSPREQHTARQRDLQARLRALPGVRDVTATGFLPLSGVSYGFRWSTEDRTISGTADYQPVLPGYFHAMGTPLLDGREFTVADTESGRNLAIVDRQFAAKAFGPGPAVGRRFLLLTRPSRPETYEVIGVVAHQRSTSVAEAGREQYYIWKANLNGYWAVRVAGDPARYAAAVRSEIARFDPKLLVENMQPMQALVDRAEANTRFALLLLGIFAALAALLAAVGLYSVCSTLVRQRTAEIGVRMAFGASPGAIFRWIAGQGLALSALGLGMGLAAALSLTRVIGGMLVGIRPTDPATFAAMAAVFLLIAGAASWIPARRAARLDPAAALREE